MVGFLSGLLLFVIVLGVLLGLFLAPLLVWRAKLKKRGYPGLLSYLQELPWTDEQRWDAVELTLKGMVLCTLGLLFPPVVLIGLVPLYYGLRKLAWVQLGMKGDVEPE